MLSSKRAGLKQKIIVSACVMMAAVLLLVFGAGYLFLRQTVSQNTEAVCFSGVTAAAHTLDNLIQHQQDEASYTANEFCELAFAGGSLEALETYLTRRMAYSSGMLALYAGINGKLVRAAPPAPVPSDALDDTAAIENASSTGTQTPDEASSPPEEQSWYQQAAASGRPVLLPVHYDEDEKQQVITLAVPFYHEDSIAGVLAADYPLSYFTKAAELTLPAAGYPILLDEEQTILLHEEPRLQPHERNAVQIVSRFGETGSAELAGTAIECAHQENGISESTDYDNVVRRFLYARIPSADWTLLYAVAPEALVPAPFHSLPVLLLLPLCAILVTSVLLYLILSHLLRPIQELKTAADRAAAGDLNLDTSYNGDDELGVLYAGMHATYESLQGYIEDIAHTLGRMSRGDFTVQVQSDYAGDFAPIKAAINHISASLHGVFTEIDASARQTLRQSHQIANAAGQLTAANATQEKTIDILSASAEELRAQTLEAADGVKRGGAYAKDTKKCAADNIRNVEEVLQSLNNLQKTIYDIGRKLQKLDDIARQTDLLTLNAMTEATRKGPTGGLLMLMQQIRTISGQNASIAKETVELIRMSAQTFTDGIEAARSLSKSMETVGIKAGQSADAIQKAIDASNTLLQASRKVGQSTAGLAAVIQISTRVAEQCTECGAELGRQAHSLGRIVTSFYTKNQNASSRGRTPPTIFSASDKDFSVREDPP